MSRNKNSGWSVIRENEKLRGIIKFKMADRELTAAAVARMLNLRPDNTQKYLRGVKPSLTDIDICRIADFLGVEVYLDFKFKD